VVEFDVQHGCRGARLIEGEALPPKPLRLDWEDERLVFVVREPFVSKTSRAGIVAGLITPKAELVLESRTPENGVILATASRRITSHSIPARLPTCVWRIRRRAWSCRRRRRLDDRRNTLRRIVLRVVHQPRDGNAAICEAG